MKQVWFITGSSRGFGRALVRAALEAGDLVAATARRPDQLADLSAEYGDSIHPIALDVTNPAAASAIAEARDRFGRLDVIVNNAGYANVSPIETTTDADFRAQFETNFWGVYNVSKAASSRLTRFSSVRACCYRRYRSPRRVLTRSSTSRRSSRSHGFPCIAACRYWSLPARIAAMISSCVNPNSERAVLSLSVAPLRPHSSP